MTRKPEALLAAALAAILELGSVLGASVLAAGCRGGPLPDVAELSTVLSGRAERSVQGKPWQPSHAGDRFQSGDGIRTSAGGGARLRFLAGGGLRMGPSTTIRFGAEALAVEGELEAEGDREAFIQLEMGRAQMAPGSRVRIGRRGHEIRFDVLVGKAVVTRARHEMEVAAGQALEVDLESARVERVGAWAVGPAAGPGTRPGAAGGSGALADGAAPAADEPSGVRAGAGAVVAEVRGAPVRMRRPGVDAEWTHLAEGKHGLPEGAELSVPPGSALALVRDDERALVQGAAELVVAPGGPGGPLAETRRGRTQVHAVTADVAIRVPGGMIVARRGGGSGSRADLGVERGETRVAVTGGVVDVVGDQGGEQRLLLGQSAAVERDGGLRVLGHPPERADFSVAAGLSATIHDPSPPTDVRIRFDELCPESGLLEVAAGQSFRSARVMVQGRGSAIGRFPRGGHRYRVRCFEGDLVSDRVMASGRLHVVKDSGTRPLARGAPHNNVDADGRRYTVLYQNRLPTITFRWAEAPGASGYRLIVAPRRGSRIELDLPTASHTIESGVLGEGQYRYWFEAIGRGRTSRPSTLAIDFDNAASSGYVMSPRPEAEWSGASLVVSGAAIEGWRVTVGGTELALDRQRRFSGAVPRDPDENGIAVQFSHPSHGVHLYVRRAHGR